MKQSLPASPRGIPIPSLLFVRLRLDAGNRDRPAHFVDRDERQVRRIGVRTLSGEEILLRNAYTDFQRRVERSIDRRFQRHHFPDQNGMVKVQLVDGGRYTYPVGMAGCRNCSRNIDHVHQPSTKEIAQTIGIVGQHHLGHFHQ